MQALQQNSSKTSAMPHDRLHNREDNQPSHYELYPLNEIEKESKSQDQRSRVGEFEMPVMDDHHDLHAAPKAQEKTEEVNQPVDQVDKAMQMGVHLANGLSILTSGYTAVKASMTKDDKAIKQLNSLASFGAKLSMGVNSLFNIYNGHKRKDIPNVVGYLGEMLVAALAPYDVMGLLRGATFSTYQTSNILASLKPMEKSETYSDYARQYKERLPILFKKLFDLKTYTKPMENLGVLTGGWGGLFSFAGVLGWAGTGSTKFGGWVKGIGELLVDSYQVVTKDHWDCGRNFYIGSGLAFIMGSLCEIISKQRNNDPVTMALYFFGSGVGRLLYTISNILGENEYTPKLKTATS